MGVIYLNLNEINNISDEGLREIKKRHWDYRHQAFINEKEISDLKVQKLWDEDAINEQREIDEYLRNKNKEGD